MPTFPTSIYRAYLDAPMQYLFGSPSKSPDQKTIPNPKGTTLEGPGNSLGHLGFRVWA